MANVLANLALEVVDAISAKRIIGETQESSVTTAIAIPKDRNHSSAITKLANVFVLKVTTTQLEFLARWLYAFITYF